MISWSNQSISCSSFTFFQVPYGGNKMYVPAWMCQIFFERAVAFLLLDGVIVNYRINIFLFFSHFCILLWGDLFLLIIAIDRCVLSFFLLVAISSQHDVMRLTLEKLVRTSCIIDAWPRVVKQYSKEQTVIYLCRVNSTRSLLHKDTVVRLGCGWRFLVSWFKNSYPLLGSLNLAGILLATWQSLIIFRFFTSWKVRNIYEK